MKAYWVEGLYISKKAKGRAAVEPFARTIWANSPEEALRLATESVAGGQWKEGPTVSQKTEEQQMRASGAPELPGFGAALKKPARKSK
jgi:hypothetical protein